jgi:hypothetical protein
MRDSMKQVERLIATRLRYSINTHLEDRGITTPGAQGDRRPARPRHPAGGSWPASAGGEGPMSSVAVPVPETAMPDWPTAEGERALRQALGYTATTN